MDRVASIPSRNSGLWNIRVRICSHSDRLSRPRRPYEDRASRGTD
jgi:hypothetical protein